MKRLACTLLLALLPLAAPAQDGPAFDAMMSRLDAARVTDDGDEIYAALNEGIRHARAEGKLTPGWAIFYAMLTDTARIQRNNPAFALQLADEGLALVEGQADLNEVGWALMVSRAYALADLGRYAEAVKTGRIAEPLFRGAYGDEAADEFAGYMAQWERGELGDFNRSVLEIAQQRIIEAEAQVEAGEYGRAIATAQAARVPAVSGPVASRAQGLNFRAEHVIGLAQLALNRPQDACASFTSALSHVAAPWDGTARIEWRMETESPEDRALLYLHMSRLSSCATMLQQVTLAKGALAEAEDLALSPDQKADAMVSRSALLVQEGDYAAAHALLEESAALARSAGSPRMADTTAFYSALLALNTAPILGHPPDPDRLRAAAEALLAQEDPPLPHEFVLREAAQGLLNAGHTSAALELAERAVEIRREAVLRSTDSQFGIDQARVGMAAAVETFLSAAHGVAEAEAPPGACPAAEYRHCIIID